MSDYFSQNNHNGVIICFQRVKAPRMQLFNQQGPNKESNDKTIKNQKDNIVKHPARKLSILTQLQNVRKKACSESQQHLTNVDSTEINSRRQKLLDEFKQIDRIGIDEFRTLEVGEAKVRPLLECEVDDKIMELAERTDKLYERLEEFSNAALKTANQKFEETRKTQTAIVLNSGFVQYGVPLALGFFAIKYWPAEVFGGFKRSEQSNGKLDLARDIANYFYTSTINFLLSSSPPALAGGAAALVSHYFIKNAFQPAQDDKGGAKAVLTGGVKR